MNMLLLSNLDTSQDVDATKNIQDKEERARPQSVVTRPGMHNKQHVNWPPPAIPLPPHNLRDNRRSPGLPPPYCKSVTDN